MEKTHWKKLHNPNYLGAYSLGDSKNDMIVTIDKVVNEMVQGADGKKEQCTVAHMKTGKPMILNVTNCKTIAKIADSSFIEDWNGVKIALSFVARAKSIVHGASTVGKLPTPLIEAGICFTLEGSAVSNLIVPLR